MTSEPHTDFEGNGAHASTSSISSGDVTDRSSGDVTDRSSGDAAMRGASPPASSTQGRETRRISVAAAGLICLLAAAGLLAHHVSMDNHGDRALAKMLVEDFQNKRARTMADVSRLADTFSQWEAHPKEALTVALERTIAHNPAVRTILVADPDGRILAMVDADLPLGQNPQPPVVLDPADQRRALVTSRALPLQLYRIKANHVVALEWAAPIRRDGRVTGYVGATTSLDPFLSKARSIVGPRMTILDGSCKVSGSKQGDACPTDRPAGPWTIILEPATLRARWTGRWTISSSFLLLLGASVFFGFLLVSDLVGHRTIRPSTVDRTDPKHGVRPTGGHGS
ncbi:MAG: PDC sensor domain-containing protein [Deltaproteobacteria bacterium]|nr:PDC sensor domain-containing protein [Deltaproteobacteria bacterium]